MWFLLMVLRPFSEQQYKPTMATATIIAIVATYVYVNVL